MIHKQRVHGKRPVVIQVRAEDLAIIFLSLGRLGHHANQLAKLANAVRKKKG